MIEWTINKYPNVLPEHDCYLVHVKDGDYLIACPEQDGWWSEGVRINHSDVTHFCLIRRP